MKVKFIIASLVVAFTIGLFADKAYSCTNVIITRGASFDGSNMVSYAADSHLLYGELYFHPAMDWTPGSMLKIFDWDSGKYLGEIPQVLHTYKTVGNMNEHQLIIGETTYGGREELHDDKGGIDYGSMIYIALQRAKTAREAIKVMTDLANKYGYYSEGESFTIADKNEVWIMDLIGKGVKMVEGNNVNKGVVWVARRVPDGYISAHANKARISTFPLNDPDNCIYAKDVITFAREKGYFKGEDKDFSFCDAYCPLSFMEMRACEARVWSAFNILGKGKFIFQDDSGKEIVKDAADYLDYAMGYNKNNPMPLWIKPADKVTVKNLADVMRDHYEGTPMDMTTDIGAGGNGLPYRWRPLTFKFGDKTYVNERAIATQQTGFWFVGQARSKYPDVIGGLLWFGVDDAATSYLTPIYTNIDKVPFCLEQGNGDMLTYSATSSFWLNNRVANACYKMYNYMAPDVKKAVDEYENTQMAYISKVDNKAMDMYSKDAKLLNSKVNAMDYTGKKFNNIKFYLTNYSVSSAEKQFEIWKQLEITLLVKFIDGNIKGQDDKGNFIRSPYSKHIPGKLEQPGYTNYWKSAVVDQQGKILEVE